MDVVREFDLNVSTAIRGRLSSFDGKVEVADCNRRGKFD